ncbi:hypothetical protein ACP4OV_025834 [Aristida adscensionis]
MAAGAAAALAVALAFLLLCASSAAAAPGVTTDGSAASYGYGGARTEAEARAMYELWLARHGRARGALAGGEHDRRFRAFWDNLRFVDAHNARAGGHGYRLGMNRFADLTNGEFRAAYLGRRGGAARGRNATTVGERYHHDGAEALPESVDWREAGAVAPVKDQGQCGSCWEFSAVGAVEGAHKIATGELVTLSEQELVDCSKNGQNSGCNGGMMVDAFACIAGNGGVDTDEDYPYTGRGGACDLAKKRRRVVSIDGFEDVPRYDELSLQKAVAHQPVAVAIEAGGREFQLYESVGRVHRQVRHVAGPRRGGGGVRHGGGRKGYWTVRNSWGAGWGEAGYIRMERGVSSRAGKCGIAMEASYPVKAGRNPPPPAVACDRYGSACPAGSTCCCSHGVRRLCLVWGCCPAEGATCCRDRATCCPAGHPVCNVRARTRSKARNSEDKVPALVRVPAARQRRASSLIREDDLVSSVFSI